MLQDFYIAFKNRVIVVMGTMHYTVGVTYIRTYTRIGKFKHETSVTVTQACNILIISPAACYKACDKRVTK